MQAIMSSKPLLKKPTPLTAEQKEFKDEGGTQMYQGSH